MTRDSRAVLAFIFGLIGGIAILLTPLVLLPSILSPFSPGYYPFLFGIVGFFLTLSSGVLVLLGATMVFQNPAQGVPWGAVMILFGALSIVGLGGFIVGMAFAIAGGALAIAAGALPVTYGPSSGQRACLHCGMLYASEFAHCPHCGKPGPPSMRPPPPSS